MELLSGLLQEISPEMTPSNVRLENINEAYVQDKIDTIKHQQEKP
jgi:hypothetical protein